MEDAEDQDRDAPEAANVYDLAQNSSILVGRLSGKR